jgi:hypothetical protein
MDDGHQSIESVNGQRKIDSGLSMAGLKPPRGAVKADSMKIKGGMG